MSDVAALPDQVEIELTVNGERWAGRVEPRLLLVHLLREEIGHTGPHVGCVVGRCGACSVIMDGQVVKSCMVLAVQADGREVLTVEGLEQDGRLHPLQESFWECDAAECGYCTSGMLMAGYALLQSNPSPDEADIRRAISGNLCRCTGYLNIIEAIDACGAGFPVDSEAEG